MKHTFENVTIDRLNDIAFRIIEFFPNFRIFAFYGNMGAGKTTLIKKICKHLKVEDIVNSPTFSLVNEYHTTLNESVFHFDFYRLNKISEAFDMGYEDYFYSGKYCFIEWPEKIAELLPENFVKITIDETQSITSRNIVCEINKI